MNDQVKESTNEITKDIPISQLDPMLKLEISREVVQELSGQINHWLNMKPVDNKATKRILRLYGKPWRSWST